MSFPSSTARLVMCAAVAAACSHATPPATPAPQPADARQSAAPGQANLTGDWAVQLIVQGQSPSTGIMRLAPSGDGYTGNLQLEGVDRPYFVRSVQVEGSHVRMALDTPDGEARIEGNLRAPTQFEAIYISRTLNGRFTASRR